MKMRIRVLWQVAALLCALAVPAHAKRVALVIGNDNYLQVKKLDKAGNDAEAMARELQAAGFEVMKHRDLNFKSLVRVFETFYDRIAGGDEVAFFYAGHGVQTKTGSYLLPTDIEGETESQVEKTSYPVNALLEELEKAKPQFSLVVVDACRDNPLRSRGRTIGAARGLVPPDVAKGQMVIFSAGRGQQALDSLSDDDPNPNGVFTREFIARMRKPGVSVEAIALDVRTSVEKLASTVGHTQRPYVINEASGNFYFFGPVTITPTAPVIVNGTGTGVGAAPSEATREDKFWEDTKAPDNIEGYEAYLAVYPAGRYAGLARAHIVRLRSKAGAVPGSPSISPSTPGTPAPAAVPKPASTPPAPPATPAPVSAPSTTPAVPPPPPPAAPAAVTPPAAPAAPAVPAVAQPTAVKGRTKVTLSNGDRYEGEVIGVVRSGRGVYMFANGDRYEGEFADNLFHGRGAKFYANGDRFEGQFVHAIQQGPGVHTFANGDRFEGNFRDNLFDGKGSFIYISGDRYDGNFVQGAKQGMGVYQYANGDRYEGEFAQNVFSGKGKLSLVGGDRYEGEFRNNTKDGRGIHYFVNQDRYEGEFKDGVQSGMGTHFYTNGDRYVGTFANGVRHGKGVYHFASGQIKEITFVNGVEK